MFGQNTTGGWALFLSSAGGRSVRLGRDYDWEVEGDVPVFSPDWAWSKRFLESLSLSWKSQIDRIILINI